MKKIFLLFIVLKLSFVFAAKTNILDNCIRKATKDTMNDIYNFHAKCMQCYISEISRLQDKIKNQIDNAKKGHNNFNKGDPIYALNKNYYNKQLEFIENRCSIYSKLTAQDLISISERSKVYESICEINELKLFDKFISRYVQDANFE